jgi:hypothetical protein
MNNHSKNDFPGKQVRFHQRPVDACLAWRQHRRGLPRYRNPPHRHHLHPRQRHHQGLITIFWRPPWIYHINQMLSQVYLKARLIFQCRKNISF